jgi:hypothetical protein
MMPMPSACAACGDREIVDGLAVDADLAAVRLVDAGQDLHQRGLARAVLAHQGVNLARAQIEADAAQRTGEALFNTAHVHDGRGGSSFSGRSFARHSV